MISTRKNFVFVHIPKTGGNSLSQVLVGHSDDALYRAEPHQDLRDRFEVRGPVTVRKHATAAEYIDRIGLERFLALRKVTLIRNPFTRAMSAYFSPNRWAAEENGRIFIRPFTFDKSDFRSFIRDVAPMTDFLHYRGSLVPFDYIARFERYSTTSGNCSPPATYRRLRSCPTSTSAIPRKCAGATRRWRTGFAPDSTATFSRSATIRRGCRARFNRLLI